MGTFDEYCTICGGPPYVPSFDANDEADHQPLTSTPPPNPADYTWLESFLGISNKEEPIPLAPYDCYGGFDIPPDMSPSYNYFRIGCRHNDDELTDEKTVEGYACHVTCYHLLQQELNYTLKYADVLPLLVDNDCYLNTFSWSDYGGLAEYQEQFFDELSMQLVKEGKLWMIEDPSRDARNKERILKVWRPLVENGFKRPEATRVGAPEVAELNVDESRA